MKVWEKTYAYWCRGLLGIQSGYTLAHSLLPRPKWSLKAWLTFPADREAWSRCWDRSDQETIPANGRIERNSNPIAEKIKSSKDCLRAANSQVYFLSINKYM